MHSIELTRLQFRNLLSYGSNITEVMLNNKGITWIKGPNGSGKSTIIEGITVALFGESYRKIPQKEMINAANQSKLWVRLEFYRRDAKGDVHYAVERTLGRSGSMAFNIWVNGELKDKEAGYSQKYFEDEIIGFNRNLFENVISLNTIQSKPFIDMDAKEKRTLLESIISLHIDKIKKLNTADHSLAMTRYDDAVGDVVKYERRLGDLEVAKQTLLREQIDDVSQLESDISTNTETLNRLVSDYATLVGDEKSIITRGTKLKDSLTKFESLDSDYNKLTELNTITTQLDRILGREAEYKNQLELYAVNLNESVSSETAANELMANFQSELERSYGVCAMPILKSNERTLMTDIANLNANIRILTVELDHIKSENDALKSGIPCPTCGKESTDADIETMRKSLRKQWTSANNKKKSNQSELEIKSKQLDVLGDHIKRYEMMSIEVANMRDSTKRIRDLLDSTNKAYSMFLSGITESKQKIEQITAYFSGKSTDQILVDLQEKKTERSLVESEINNLRSELAVLKNKMTSIGTTKMNVEKSISVLDERLRKRKNAGSGSSLALNEEQIITTRSDIADARHRVTKYSEEIELIKYIDKMYGDDGIKKFVLGIFVPNLNQVIAHNIALFALPFAIEFDEALDYKFIGKFGMAQIYKGLSQGQQRKLNFCISMAFRDFVSLIADFNINLMFLDEVLDISTDAEGLRDMIELIKQKGKDIESIYLMSHRGEDFDDEWEHLIEVSNDGLYSRAIQTY